MTIVILQTRNTAMNSAHRISEAQARDTANLIRSEMETALGVARSIEQNFQNYEEIPIGQRRENFSMILKNALKGNENFLNVWTIWEPNAIDGQDNLHHSSSDSDTAGRYMPGYLRSETGIKKVVNSIDESSPDSAFYTIPKSTRKETLMEPSSPFGRVFPQMLASPGMKKSSVRGGTGMVLKGGNRKLYAGKRLKTG